MNRRSFIQLGLAGIGGTIVAPRLAIASASDSTMSSHSTSSRLVVVMKFAAKKTPQMHLADGVKKCRRICRMLKSRKDKTGQ